MKHAYILSMIHQIDGFNVEVDDSFQLIPHEFSVYKNRNTFYCYRKRDSVFLHHLVIGRSKILVVDHKDRNGLNNKKDNLQFVTRSQNAFNSIVFNTTKGTYKCSKTGKWYARIKIGNNRISYGPYITEQEAKFQYKKLLVRARGGM